MATINFEKSNHIESQELIIKHLQSMQYPLDSYMETKMRNSIITKIIIDDEARGYIATEARGYIATIEDMIWFFYLLPESYALGSDVLAKFIAQTHINKTTVLTCDIAYNGILSDFSLELVSKEGRYFSDNGNSAEPATDVADAIFRQATLADIPLLEETTKGYYADFHDSVVNERVYLLEKDGVILGCGTLNPSGLFEDWISLGVTVVREHRKIGVGTKLLWHLKQVAYEQNLSVMAGSWYYNTLVGKCLTKVNMLPIAKEMCYLIKEQDAIPLKSGTLVVTEID